MCWKDSKRWFPHKHFKVKNETLKYYKCQILYQISHPGLNILSLAWEPIFSNSGNKKTLEYVRLPTLTCEKF